MTFPIGVTDDANETDSFYFSRIASQWDSFQIALPLFIRHRQVTTFILLSH